jgi:hypothetical protein
VPLLFVAAHRADDAFLGRGLEKRHAREVRPDFLQSLAQRRQGEVVVALGLAAVGQLFQGQDGVEIRLCRARDDNVFCGFHYVFPR